MYRPRTYRTINRLSPYAQRYHRTLPWLIRQAHQRQATQNPRSLLALAYRQLHRPYNPRAIRPTSNVNRRRIRARNPR